MKVVNVILIIISFLSFLFLFLAINVNLDLKDVFYYLGGGNYLSIDSIDGRFEFTFLFTLTVTNLSLLLSLVFYKKDVLYSALCILGNTALLFLNYNLVQYRTFDGYSYDPEVDNYLRAVSSGYLYRTADDLIMYLIIVFHLVIVYFSRKSQAGREKE